ncbi:MAG: hypothetical protein DME22_24465 [Verrucomicrobia bacterium]|nr:MAG: hypothetical protein DME22_24465 [Verrucomicrobiota bacterium]
MATKIFSSARIFLPLNRGPGATMADEACGCAETGKAVSPQFRPTKAESEFTANNVELPCAIMMKTGEWIWL